MSDTTAMKASDAELRDSRLAIAFSNIGHTCTHMFTVLYATAVLHLPSVFGLEYGELIQLASVGLVLYGVAGLPAGWLGDRWSQVGMMVIFFIGIGVGALVTGIATGTTGLFVGLTLIGLFAAIYHPVGIAWLVAAARRTGMSLGINGVFGNVGSAVAPVFVGVMIDHVSWRAAFILPGALSMLVGIALALVWWRGRIADIRTERNPSPPPAPGATRRAFLVLTLTMACTGFVYTGLVTTYPKVFEVGLGEALAVSYTEIGLYAGAIIGLASATSIAGGWLADRFSPRLVYIVFWLLSAAPLFFVPVAGGGALLAIALAALALNVTFAPAENMLVARYTPFEWRSLAYGARFVLALGVGGLTVSLAGEIFDRTGTFELLYAMFGAAALCAGSAALLLPGEGRPASAP